MTYRTQVFPFIVLLIAATMIAAVLFVSPGSSAAPSSPCTKVGTSGADSITGTGGGDYLCARAGDDYATALAGTDTVLGEGGADTLIGGAGRDDVRGGDGNDQLFVVDQVNNNDRIDGGGGTDRCYLDVGDTARNCETVTRGATAEAFIALDVEFAGLATLAEGFQNRPTETPPPPPQCTPPPDIPPDQC
jgi:Ca2+-binding RTX toxin-like protein